MSKSILKKPRIWILVAFILISLAAINPQLDITGVAIKFVDENSNAYDAGLRTPQKETAQVNYEKIIEINGEKVNNLQDYNRIIGEITPTANVRLITNKAEYSFEKDLEDLGINVKEPASSNLRKGLDLQGGTRVLLEPKEEISNQQVQDLISVMDRRLNTYGLSDIQIKSASDIDGNKFILVEIAGATEKEVQDIIASQGLFEAKIKNETIFTGGKEDISFVCRNDGSCSGIRSCQQNPDGSSVCRFEFVIELTTEAARRHADATRDLDIVTEGDQTYLSEKIQFYLDGELVDELNIGADLKGVEATSILISGPGIGDSEEEAFFNSQEQMNKLQTILLTGSFPFELEIVKLDTISPVLGKEFINNAFLAGLFAIIAVSVVVFTRYKNLKISLPMMLFSVSEVLIILGFSALMRYNLDLAAIAGIIAAVGTGVDDQIVIIDEVLHGAKEQGYKWKEKLKRAFFIIMIAYVTTIAAMIPLLWAGAGLIRGFALVTMIGVSVGVFLTRPAFAAVIKAVQKEE